MESNDWFFELFGPELTGSLAEDFAGLSEEERYAEWSLYATAGGVRSYSEYCDRWSNA